MTRLGELRDLYRYHRWANGKVLDATAQLAPADFDRDLANSFGSIRATLAHILGADWIWLRRWTGDSPTTFPTWDTSTRALLVEKWREVEGEQEGFMDGLGEDDLDRVFDYTLMSGAAFSSPFWEMARHVVNHATYHRGQVVTMLRQLKMEPPHTDLILWFRER